MIAPWASTIRSASRTSTVGRLTRLRALHLQRPALQQVDPVLSVGQEIDGELDVHRILVGLLQGLQHVAHVVDERRVRQQPVEGQHVVRAGPRLRAEPSCEATMSSGRSGVSLTRSRKCPDAKRFAARSR